MLHAFDHIVGNEQVKKYLIRLVERESEAHSLLFTGIDGIGKSLFAQAYAELILCSDDPTGNHKRKVQSKNHPDLFFYHPEGKLGLHSMETMRQFIQDVYLPPFEAKKKVFIINDADRMLSYSANALLKTFEEPAAHSLIILISSSPDALLPTILSRCLKISFSPLSKDDIATTIEKKLNRKPETVLNRCQGSLGKAIKLVEADGEALRALVLSFLSKGDFKIYSRMVEAVKDIAEHVEQAQKTREQELREEMAKVYPEGLTSLQKQALEREVEGILAIELLQHANAVFDCILSWYRDLQLLKVNGNLSYLFNPDYLPSLQKSFERGEFRDIHSLVTAIDYARLALARSTPLENCLEYLFLKDE